MKHVYDGYSLLDNQSFEFHAQKHVGVPPTCYRVSPHAPGKPHKTFYINKPKKGCLSKLKMLVALKFNLKGGQFYK
jgi:hypothetical protein